MAEEFLHPYPSTFSPRAIPLLHHRKKRNSVAETSLQSTDGVSFLQRFVPTQKPAPRGGARRACEMKITAQPRLLREEVIPVGDAVQIADKRAGRAFARRAGMLSQAQSGLVREFVRLARIDFAVREHAIFPRGLATA
jgi:hypothetical protein